MGGKWDVFFRSKTSALETYIIVIELTCLPHKIDSYHCVKEVAKGLKLHLKLVFELDLRSLNIHCWFVSRSS